LEEISKHDVELSTLLHEKFKQAVENNYHSKLEDQIDDYNSWKDQNKMRSLIGIFSAKKMVEIIESKFKDRIFLDAFDRTLKAAYSDRTLNLQHFISHKGKLIDIKDMLLQEIPNKEFIDRRWCKILIETVEEAICNFV